LPFPDGSASAVYASHLLEHLYPEQGRQLIGEALRVLASGGILRIVVPDLGSIIREYLGERPFGALPPEMEDLRPADRLNKRLLMRWPPPSSSNLFYRIYEGWQDLHSHKWMYDRDSLIHLLTQTGFVDVQDKKCHESYIEGIQMVEDPSRLLNGAGICVEGVRPARG
jgi:predicted SAM-dependent methyltransferase